jgi:capsular exopolysaccharide synthesis family protein
MKVLARYYPQYAVPQATRQPEIVDEDANYYYSDQVDETKHLRDYWRVILKRSHQVLPVFLAVVSLGLLICFFSPTLYTAQSTLKIEPPTPASPTIPDAASLASDSRYDYYQTQFALLNSAPLAALVIKQLGLESNPSFTSRGFNLISWAINSISSVIDSLVNLFRTRSTENRPSAYELGVAPSLVSHYRSFLEIKPVRNTRLVNISFDTPDPTLSQQLANAHATSFIRLILENHFSLTQEARDFLSKKLADLRQKVVKAEAALNKFRQEHGVVSIEKGENIVLDRLMDLNKQLTQARAERIQAESLFHMTRNKNPDYLAQVLTNPLIVQIKASLASLETERSRLASIYTPEHPRLQELSQQIAGARKTLASEVRNIVHGIESTYSAARAREDALGGEAQRQQQTALDLKHVGVDYAVLNEEVVVNRGLYENVLKRLNDTNVSNDLAASNIRVIQRAEVPSVSSSPNSVKILAIATILGLFLSVALAFFMEYMDSTMSTPQQVWAAVSLATLGVVPHLGSLRERSHPMLSNNASTNRLEPSALPDERVEKEIVVAQHQFSMIAESYRSIRTALMLTQAERPPKVILLTSPCPNEGKTVSTLNLGIALAQSGKRVLAIDADLRKGRCHKLLHVRNHYGLTNVLTQQLDIKTCIHETAIKDFYVLPRGALPPNPADLLMSQRMCDILNELRSSFDFIVIDSPPTIAVSDSAVLSALCDGVVLVVDGQKTTTQSAKRAMEVLDKVGARSLGVILNGIDIRHHPDYVDYRTYYASYSADPVE